MSPESAFPARGLEDCGSSDREGIVTNYRRLLETYCALSIGKVINKLIKIKLA